MLQIGILLVRIFPFVYLTHSFTRYFYLHTYNFLGYEQIFHSVRLLTFSTFTISLMVFYTTIETIQIVKCNLFSLIDSVLFWKPFHAICFTNIFVECCMFCFIHITICMWFYFYLYMKASLRIELTLMKSIPSRDKYANIKNSRKKTLWMHGCYSQAISNLLRSYFQNRIFIKTNIKFMFKMTLNVRKYCGQNVLFCVLDFNFPLNPLQNNVWLLFKWKNNIAVD